MTHEEMLQALAALVVPTEEGFTRAEAEGVLGLGACQTGRRLHELVEAGALRPVHVTRTNPWGVTRRMQGYAPVGVRRAD